MRLAVSAAAATAACASGNGGVASTDLLDLSAGRRIVAKPLQFLQQAKRSLDSSMDCKRVCAPDAEEASEAMREALLRLSTSDSNEERRSSNAAAQAINGSKSCQQLLAGGEQLPRDLDPLLMPKHVALIMDGNSRWAKSRGWSPNRGHQAGVEALREVVKLSSRWGIKVLTVFAFSTENWSRPKAEIDFLMQLVERVLSDDTLNVVSKEDISIKFIGMLSKLSPSLQRLIAQVERKTSDKQGLKLVIALSYSGRQDLVQAFQSIAEDVKAGRQSVEGIDESIINGKLLVDGEPDVLIRTSGEMRLSNFLLWQMAYTELVFVDALWPDFGEAEYRAALLAYQRRDRRFGSHSHA